MEKLVSTIYEMPKHEADKIINLQFGTEMEITELTNVLRIGYEVRASNVSYEEDETGEKVYHRTIGISGKCPASLVVSMLGWILNLRDSNKDKKYLFLRKPPSFSMDGDNYKMVMRISFSDYDRKLVN